MLMRLLKEPLVQFAFLGAALFAVHAQFRDAPADDHLIHITQADLEPLQRQWQTLYGRAPLAEERERLLEQFIREEVLVREAQRLGIDAGDPVIRQRLASKFLFLSHQYLEKSAVDDAALRAWYDTQTERYRSQPQTSFRHVFFSQRLRGNNAAADALALLDRWQKETPPARPQNLGDRFMLHGDYALADQATITSHFGRDFTEQLDRAPLHQWVGPLASVAGYHLVFVSARRDAAVPDFESQRARIRADYDEARRHQAETELVDTLRARYQVVVDAVEPGA